MIQIKIIIVVFTKIIPMKKLSLCIFLVLMFSLFTSHSFAETIPKNDPVPDGVMYRGINEEQWKIIEKIGDPLNCRKKVYASSLAPRSIGIVY